MSHELRTPLNAILGFSQVLRKDRNLTDGQRRRVDTILDGGRHLLTLINDVLDMAKIEAGHVTLDRRVFDPGTLIREVSDMVRNEASKKGLRLALDLPDHLPANLEGDEGKLRQVLVNLLVNAVKYTDEGCVTLRVATRPDGRPARVRLAFEIEDTGIGIKPEDVERIFDPFTQAERHHAAKGTGLGLAITRRHLEIMGGGIALESEPGKGSLFRFEIPVRIAAEPGTAADAARWRNGVGLAPGKPAPRILIVEDQTENRVLLRELLEPVGFELREAADGVAAVAEFEAWRPDFIWMDIRMPMMDGLEATRLIRETEAGRTVKIVAITAHAFETDHEGALAAGCDDFVRKPFSEEEIFDTIARHLEVEYVSNTPT